MAADTNDALDALAGEAVAIADIQSAAIFVARQGSAELDLGGVAGIAGPPLDGLRAAVLDPNHPIRRTMGDDGPTFDVRPMAPGGPALRSHLPLVADRDGRRANVGVLAVAHDRPLEAGARAALVALADRAAAIVAGER